MTKSIAGAKVALKLDGVKVAFLSGVSMNVENTLIPINVLDLLEVAEYAEVGHVCGFSCNYIKIDENAAAVIGLEPSNLNDILSQGEKTMEIYDRVGDKKIFTISGVKWAGGNGSIDARGVFQGTWNFQGRVAKGL